MTSITEGEPREQPKKDIFAYEIPERPAFGRQYLETTDRLLRKHGILPAGIDRTALTGHVVTPTVDLYVFDATIPARAAGDFGTEEDGTAGVLIRASIEFVNEGNEATPTAVVNRDMSDTTTFVASQQGLGEGYSVRGNLDTLEKMEKYYDKQTTPLSR